MVTGLPVSMACKQSCDTFQIRIRDLCRSRYTRIMTYERKMFENESGRTYPLHSRTR
jgi:hypothetical protein